MTKVQLRYDLARPLDEPLMRRVAESHSLFGLLRVQLSPDGASVHVEYDASRLTPAQMIAALHRAGIPVRAKA